LSISNPAFLSYKNASSGKIVHTLWTGDGHIHAADNLNGPFETIPGVTFPGGGNPAPMFHDGSIYATSQDTHVVWTIPELKVGQNFTQFAKIDHPNPSIEGTQWPSQGSGGAEGSSVKMRAVS
jgi:hypothetical protein